METHIEERFANYWQCLEEDGSSLPHSVVANYTLVKLATRCNIGCTYCYWFRDNEVYDRPKVLTEEAEDHFLNRLKDHITTHKVPTFLLLFHGGEPLLFGKNRFNNLCNKVRSLEAELGFELKLAVTTNGLLITNEWIDLFLHYKVSVTLSIDGPATIHDKVRIDFMGGGTHGKVVAALSNLRARGIEPGVLAVCDPNSDAESVCRYFADKLALTEFDILVPDATHEDSPAPIHDYYIKLFDVWYDDYLPRGVRIRYLETLLQGLLGVEGHVESIGYGPNTTFTLLTDGSLEPLDVLRTVGDGFTRTLINVANNDLQDIQRDPLWKEVLRSSLALPVECETCPYNVVCGGGHIGTRWSKARRFDNPSVYCGSIKKILAHIWQRLSKDVLISIDDDEPQPLLIGLQQVNKMSPAIFARVP